MSDSGSVGRATRGRGSDTGPFVPLVSRGETFLLVLAVELDGSGSKSGTHTHTHTHATKQRHKQTISGKHNKKHRYKSIAHQSNNAHNIHEANTNPHEAKWTTRVRLSALRRPPSPRQQATRWQPHRGKILEAAPKGCLFFGGSMDGLEGARYIRLAL